MRLRSLRKLEEMEIRREHQDLTKEQKDLRALLKDKTRRWTIIADEIGTLRKRFGPKTTLGQRRTAFGDPPSAVVIPLEAMIEREPVTILCSAKGWVRTVKGHSAEFGDIKYKEIGSASGRERG